MTATNPNAPVAEPSDADRSLAEVFARVARDRRSRVALESPRWRATYRELDETANRLAHRLIAAGVAPGDRVAVVMEHDTPAVAAAVAGVKAGGILVFLNDTDPAERLGALIEDSGPAVIVADDRNRDLAARLAGPRPVVIFDPEDTAGTARDPAIAIAPARTASLVYTSGATGRPKGVMFTHRQFQRSVAIHTEAMRYTELDRIPLLSAFGAGQGSVSFWNGLLNGATLCPFPVRLRGVSGLAEWLIDRRLTVYTSSASIFRTLVRTIDEGLVFSGIRAVRLSSEPATAEDFRSFRRHFAPTSVFVHTLSSSETANIAWARWTPDHEFAEGILPVGRVSRGTEISILGEDGGPVAVGEEGEIVVRSRYVAAGYWNDPALTAERFSEPLDSEGTRLVRTGDRGRLNADGLLEFRGRSDDRIKIRGNRIDLADIESALDRLPGIERAAAVAVPREGLEPMLAAFVVKSRGATWTAARLRQAVASILPLHMLPSRVIFVDSLPHNPGGKVDREELRRFPLPRRQETAGAQPRTSTEVLLADIWAELLDLPEVYLDDDFFMLGGDSLAAAVVAAEVHTALGTEIDLVTIAGHSTVRLLAGLLDASETGARPDVRPIIAARRAGPVPLSLSQERVWNLWKAAEDAAAFTHARSQHVRGPLDVGIFAECLEYLIARHGILRTTFAEVDGRLAQIVHPTGPLDFSVFDASNADDPEARAETIIREQTERELDPARLPLFRYAAIKLRDDEHLMLRVLHPLIGDGFGWQILYGEHAALYEARLNGMGPPMPAKAPLQYADYAVWQRRVMAPGKPLFDATIDWWSDRMSGGCFPSDLPFRREEGRTGLDPGEGVIQWSLERETAQRLDRIARRSGVTYFTVRLAAFAALLGEASGQSTVVIGTNFVNRGRVESQRIVGPMLNLAPLVLTCRPDLSFRRFLVSVRDRVFETSAHSELPYEELCQRLREAGAEPPDIRIIFAKSSEHPDQRFGNITISNRFWSAAAMPWGCTVYVDEHKPENCRVDFDAGLYDPDGMRDLMARYTRLLAAAARDPDSSLDVLLRRSEPGTLRRAGARYRAAASRAFASLRTGPRQSRRDSARCAP